MSEEEAEILDDILTNYNVEGTSTDDTMVFKHPNYNKETDAMPAGTDKSLNLKCAEQIEKWSYFSGD